MYKALEVFNGSNVGLDSFYNKNILNESNDGNAKQWKDGNELPLLKYFSTKWFCNL
jgi:hypothetical protein